MRSVPTVVAALLLGGLGLIATSQTQVFSPGDPGLPMDARLIEQLDDQEATLNQRRQAETLLRAFVRGQLASFYWGQFASSLIDLGLSSDETMDVRVETKSSSTRLWLTPKRGSESYVAIVHFNGSKLVRLQCRGLNPASSEQTAAVCPEGWRAFEIPAV
ncbi:MAG: thymidylate synthase [Synechococcus sp. SP2 MAG]|nr:thymidylate synthase [Synechococcus sp. SP2 MAG]